jgi:hypothetical protein
MSRHRKISQRNYEIKMNHKERSRRMSMYMKKVCREQEKFIRAHRCHACMPIEFGSALLFLHIGLTYSKVNCKMTHQPHITSDDTLLPQQEIYLCVRSLLECEIRDETWQKVNHLKQDKHFRRATDVRGEIDCTESFVFLPRGREIDDFCRSHQMTQTKATVAG